MTVGATTGAATGFLEGVAVGLAVGLKEGFAVFIIGLPVGLRVDFGAFIAVNFSSGPGLFAPGSFRSFSASLPEATWAMHEISRNKVIAKEKSDCILTRCSGADRSNIWCQDCSISQLICEVNIKSEHMNSNSIFWKMPREQQKKSVHPQISIPDPNKIWLIF